MTEKSKEHMIDRAAADCDTAESSEAFEWPDHACDELEARLRFETLIADLSLKFINLPARRSRPGD